MTADPRTECESSRANLIRWGASLKPELGGANKKRSVNMQNKPPDKRHKNKTVAEPSPQRGMPGIAPIDPEAFSRRAGEIIAKAASPTDEKASESENDKTG